MHEKYGPIVRINPYELHVADASFYDEIYAGAGRRRDKWEWFTNQFGIPESIFATADHDKHRMRRAALHPFFSMASVRRLQPLIEERLEKFLARLDGFKTNGEVMTLSLGWAAFTNGRLVGGRVGFVDGASLIGRRCCGGICVCAVRPPD